MPPVHAPVMRAAPGREPVRPPEERASRSLGSGVGERPRLVLQAASSGLSARLYREATRDPRPPAELLTYLSAACRAETWIEVEQPAALWPFPEGARNRGTFTAIRPGDWFAPCVDGRVETAHRVLAVDSEANLGKFFGGESVCGLLLVLGAPRAVGIPYALLFELAKKGKPSGPTETVLLTGDVAEQAVATLGLLDKEKTHPTDPGPHSDPDEMDRWYRQGLVAQRDALRAALHSLSEGNVKAIESVRRVTGAFGLRFLDRFPDLSKEGTAVSRLIDDEIVGRTEAFVGLIEAEVGLDRAKPARILLVEDEPTSAAKVRSMLAAPNREILHCTTRAEAGTILTQQSIDLVLLDLSLPDADGRDLLVEIRDRPSTSAMPVIVLSSADGAQPQTEGFALGADAYFTKSVHPSVLSAAVSSFLQRAAQIRDQTLRDPLTGLKTRTVFISALSDTWVAMVRKTEPFTLAIIDVDRITALNDFHGREAGDAVLRDLGHRLKALFRRSDLTARWGGDEFAVAFPHTDIEGARRALEKLQREHSSAQEEHLAGGRHITFSAGVVSLETQESPEDAIEIAERRLVEAARGAGGRIVIDDDGLGPMSTTILVVEDDPLTAQLIAERLTRDNWNVVHMTDGMEALEAIPTMDVAAVLLDVATPGADGFGILRRLRRSPALAHVPIMMLTMDRETQVSRAFQMGATDILRKPFALSELVARVRTLVERG